MLRSFRVANHKSFRDEAELLLLPAYDKSSLAVPVAAVFGANASGKSNLLDALRWFQSAVRESYARWEPGPGVPRAPFLLDPAASAQPSLYCVEIVVDGSRCTYGLEVDDERVREEWLYTCPHSRRRTIFARQGGTIRLDSTVPDHRARGEQLARQTRVSMRIPRAVTRFWSTVAASAPSRPTSKDCGSRLLCRLPRRATAAHKARSRVRQGKP